MCGLDIRKKVAEELRSRTAIDAGDRIGWEVCVWQSALTILNLKHLKSTLLLLI